MTAAEARGLSLSTPARFEAVAGQGIRAAVDGRQVLVGNPKFLHREGVALDSVISPATPETDAKTTMWLAVDGQVHGAIAVSDTIKDSSPSAVSGLQQLGLKVLLIR